MSIERCTISRGMLWLGIATIVCGGCGKRAERFTPTPQVARSSIEAALDAWREGRPPGTITGGTAVVQVVDTTRLQGQTLKAFEVLSETGLGGQGRSFVVRLQLDHPAAELRARYVVVGIDPIWVFRKEDYDKLAHWEHPMEVPAAEPSSDDSRAGDRADDTEGVPAASTSPTSHERY